MDAARDSVQVSSRRATQVADRAGRYGLLSSEKITEMGVYFIILLVFFIVFFCIACIFYLFVPNKKWGAFTRKKCFSFFYFLKMKISP